MQFGKSGQLVLVLVLHERCSRLLMAAILGPLPPEFRRTVESAQALTRSM